MGRFRVGRSTLGVGGVLRNGLEELFQEFPRLGLAAVGHWALGNRRVPQWRLLISVNVRDGVSPYALRADTVRKAPRTLRQYVQEIPSLERL
jgi:hypothetical protein